MNVCGIACYKTPSLTITGGQAHADSESGRPSQIGHYHLDRQEAIRNHLQLFNGRTGRFRLQAVI
jgi:hypothetical protein